MKNYYIPDLVNAQGFLTCPVCGKEFKPNDDTKYIAVGGYTCSWKCFLNDVKRRSSKKDVKDAKERKNKK